MPAHMQQGQQHAQRAQAGATGQRSHMGQAMPRPAAQPGQGAPAQADRGCYGRSITAPAAEHAQHCRAPCAAHAAAGKSENNLQGTPLSLGPCLPHRHTKTERVPSSRL